MGYYAQELFDVEGKSIGWFVFHPDGQIEGPFAEAAAYEYAAALDRSETVTTPPYLPRNPPYSDGMSVNGFGG